MPKLLQSLRVYDNVRKENFNSKVQLVKSAFFFLFLSLILNKRNFIYTKKIEVIVPN